MKYLDAMIMKGEALRLQGHLNEARSLLQDLAGNNPDNAMAHYHLGLACIQMGDHRAAKEALSALLGLSPEFLEGRMLLGMACAGAGESEEALRHLQAVNDECPGLVEIHNKMGMIYTEINRGEDALREFKEALRINPDHAEANSNLGELLTQHCQYDEAERYIRRSIGLQPDNASAHNNLGRLYKLQGRAEEAFACFRKALDLDSTSRQIAGNLVYCLNYMPHVSPEETASEYLRIAELSFPSVTRQISPSGKTRVIGPPLRIGYVSGDFFAHSVSFFLEPILMNHDPERCQAYCYSNRGVEDDTTRRLKGLAAEWRVVRGIPDQQVAQMVADDGIDILVDLSGHTAHNRLGVFALRPSPVQVSWIGHPNTTGMAQMDYFITDAYCAPPGTLGRLYKEQLWRLPRVFSCYLPPMEFPGITAPPCQDNGSITFGCFNNLAKVHEETIRMWTDILTRVPGSRLYLKNSAMGDRSTREMILNKFSLGGIAPERIIMQGVVKSRYDHFAEYSRVDIALDTFPYHGTTTTCEALWMGVPVITMAGRTHCSRVGVSFLTNVGIPEMIAGSPDEYVARAVELAGDVSLLTGLRHELRSMMASSPLMDAAGVTREVEDAFEQMLCRHAMTAGQERTC